MSVLTFQMKFVPGAGDLQLHTTAALRVIAAAQVGHARNALFVHVHIASCIGEGGGREQI